MIVLPIVNRNRIFNVKVEMKNAKKVAKNINDDNVCESDIVVNNRSYLQSNYASRQTTPESVMKFLRDASKIGRGNVLVSTKSSVSDNKYDIYEVVNILDKITDGCDNLMGMLLLDLKNECLSSKSRYLNLKNLGVFDHITAERIEKIQYASENMGYINISKYIKENDLECLFKTLELFKYLDFTIIPSSVISLDEFNNFMNFLKPAKSKDYYNLKKYYDIALSNKNEYSKLSYLNKLVNNKSLNLIHNSKDKVKVYSNDQMDVSS